MLYLSILVTVLIAAGLMMAFDATPVKIIESIIDYLDQDTTLHNKVLIAKGKKKQNNFLREYGYIKAALAETGKSKQFTLIFLISLILASAGCFLSIAMHNIFLMPVFCTAFALLPFSYIKSIQMVFKSHLEKELETTLSVITSSYIRTENIINAVEENIEYINMPIKSVFQEFLTQVKYINADIKAVINLLKSRIDNEIYWEWCDTLIACQSDKTLVPTLIQVVKKLEDIRIVNNELKPLIYEPRKEYYTMVIFLVGIIPFLKLMSEDLYEILMYTIPGKISLAICACAILITYFLMKKFTQPIKFKR